MFKQDVKLFLGAGGKPKSDLTKQVDDIVGSQPNFT